ncbi:FAR1 DNA-binding domain protein [Medicago truncatula]|uniref:FAR1 DNA-binding domain protein n=1 Tax=Medicago truncatula TaxID=3880 RepID=A0A072VD75_MEDTR|nr:FAR1 DNA-binding domain protein [Medicago truncatula]
MYIFCLHQFMEFGDIESDMKVGFGFAIQGMEDIGKIDFKKLNASDVMKFHFPNIAVAYAFYNWYARMNGFSARRRKVRRNKNNEIIQQIFVCYRQGFREKKLENNKIRKREARADTRCGCDAKCSVHIDSGSRCWYVWDFNNDHNHSLVDDDFIAIQRFFLQTNNLMPSTVTPETKIKHRLWNYTKFKELTRSVINQTLNG